MATKATCATVVKSLPNASVEKLANHYDKFTEAYRMTDDFECQRQIVDAHMKVAEELLWRGVVTPMASLSDEETAFAERTTERGVPLPIVAKAIYVGRHGNMLLSDAEADWEKNGPPQLVEAEQ